MTTPTPSPRSSDDRLRPAALVISDAIYRSVSTRPNNGKSITEEVLAALSGHGYCLIPRAELEEAADALKLADTDLHSQRLADDLANRLRQRSRG